jgi:hypothetical protein
MTKRTTSSKTRREHPSYPNPTIAEALCEIHFVLPEEIGWKPTLPGDLFKKIQNEYPDMEPSLEVGLELELSPHRIGHSLLPPRPRMRFKHMSRPLLVQLAPNVFTVNVLPKYPGWQTMRRDVAHAWGQAKDVVKPAKVTRVGLRYINRIERQSENETPKDWFKAGDYIPAGVLESKGAFLSRVELQLDAQNRVIVTLAEIRADQATGPKGIVLDIDRILEKELSLDDEKMLREMDRLHEHVWEIFQASQGRLLTSYLKGKAK